MAEQLHGHTRMLAAGQQQCRCGVPAVVQSDVPHAGIAQQAAPVLLVGLLSIGRPWGLREDKVVLGTGQDPVASLARLVLDQRMAQVHR